jgi:ethanolamine utilization protein EutQ (cupin superfamily)
MHLAQYYAPNERQSCVFASARGRSPGSLKKIEELDMLIFLNRANDIKPEPLDVGEGKFHLVDLVSQTQGAPVSSGVAEIWKSAPVDFEYDNDCAVCYMIEGEIMLSEGDEKVSFLPGDVVYIPQTKGLVVLWESDSYGKFFYVTYPHWR